MKTAFQLMESCQEKLKILEEMIPTRQHENRLAELNDLASRGDLWNDPRGAAALMKERQKVQDILDTMKYFREQASFYAECWQVMPEELEGMKPAMSLLESTMDAFEFRQMMKDPVDDSPAIMTINAGAGGLEAANWVTMLLRMY